ncbi:flagellar hook-length control protein FliK [Vibrio japonicus]|uniref:Flagellar hook-length control protein FliK n=1 Tax=Vibrio japonicus TaxID=1824638 RepID=A0ABY5LN61_9VIBR|nr:flagellar hook-length control protein FliK [Vibrio japonicus]UUM32303.1 flagellar hook-length control protein FliK [Vibrio japonicus]
MITLATHANAADSTSKLGKTETKIAGARVDSATPSLDNAASEAAQQQATSALIFQLPELSTNGTAQTPSASDLDAQQDVSLEGALSLLDNTEQPANLLTLQAQAMNKHMLEFTNRSPVSVSTSEHQLTASLTTQLNRSPQELASYTGSKQSQSDISAVIQQTLPQGTTQSANGAFQLNITPATVTQSPAPNLPAPSQAQSSEWASVRIDTQAGKWGEQMMQVLHDRVTLQAQQNLQEAKIRLDPPELGKLDLMVRVEGDRLSVQINASATATREALMQVSERLRAELQQQNFVHVDVNVGSDQGQRHQSPQQADEDVIIFANREFAARQTQSTTDYSEHWLNTQA